MNPKVSVIIPVYNQKKEWLLRSFNSVKKQDYDNIEIILIDDGSNDGSEIVCDNLGDGDQCVIVIHQKNKRQGAARNTGLDACTGDYVYFLDSDDWIEQNTISRLVGLVLQYDAQIAVCSCFKQDSTGQIHKPSIEEVKITVLDNYQALESYVFDTEYCNHSPCDKLYAKELFDGARFIENSYYEDLGSVYKFIVNAKRVVHTNEPLYCYYDNLTSTMHKKFSPHEFDKINLYHVLANYFKAKQKNEEYSSFIKEMDKMTLYCAIGYTNSVYNQIDKQPYVKSVSETRNICKHIHSNLGLRLNVIRKLIVISPKLFVFVWKTYVRVFKVAG